MNKTVSAFSHRSFRAPALLLVFFAATMMGLESQCGVDREDPEPLDERLHGVWRDIPAEGSNPNDVLDIHEDGDVGMLIRVQHNRGNSWDQAAGTITLDGTVYTQQSGTGLSGTFVAGASGNEPSRTLTLDDTSKDYTLTWEYDNPVREQGSYQLRGSDEIVLTRPDVGGVVTSMENESIELWSRGSLEWDYRSLSGPSLWLGDQFFYKSSPGLTGGWWYNSARTRFLSFDADGLLTEVRERPDPDTELIKWRETNSYVYRNRILSSDSGRFELGTRIVGSYELLGDDEEELIVTAERPLVQRRHAITTDGETLRLGGPNGWEDYSRTDGETGLSGSWSGGGVTWTFDTTLETYTREAGGVVETGRFDLASGSSLINFHKRYHWHRKD